MNYIQTRTVHYHGGRTMPVLNVPYRYPQAVTKQGVRIKDRTFFSPFQYIHHSTSWIWNCKGKLVFLDIAIYSGPQNPAYKCVPVSWEKVRKELEMIATFPAGLIQVPWQLWFCLPPLFSQREVWQFDKQKLHSKSCILGCNDPCVVEIRAHFT